MKAKNEMSRISYSEYGKQQANVSFNVSLWLELSDAYELLGGSGSELLGLSGEGFHFKVV